MTTELLSIFIAAIFIDNIVLSQILGICPFVGVSNKMDSAVGMGVAVTFVMVMASVSTWCLYNYVLLPYNLLYLQTISFILVIASLVQFVEMLVRKSTPALYHSLGVYLPLITTNCTVLGISLINITKNYGIIHSTINALGAGLGFFLALVIMAGIRERLDTSDVPKAMQGAPISFITSALLAIAFMGFSGLI